MEKQLPIRTYVSLDLETTGLTPESDDIIEVGAVKIRDGARIDMFQTLVNPRRPIPYHITRLCGITQRDVDAAPTFSEVSEQLDAFLQGCSPVGHNVAFDLGFLARNGIEVSGPPHDTYDLAKLLLPGLGERSLGAVAAYLGIPHPSAHRALADAEVAGEIFLTLLEKLHRMEPAILAELVRLTAKTDWWISQFFDEVSQGRNANPLLEAGSFEKACLGSINRSFEPKLAPASKTTVLDIDELDHFFDDGGPLAASFPNYEHRPQQGEMMRAVAHALDDSQHLIVEAGTGTGKSMAYLLPAAIFAFSNSVPVVISTNTINLQEQLMAKDIPDLLDALGERVAGIRVVQVKGRSNYLCLRRWETLRRTKGLPFELVQLLVRIQVWLPSTQTGDRSELNLDSWELRFWPRVCAQSFDCLGRRCDYLQQGRCFLYQAREAAESAHLIVTNHALLLSEIAAGAQILPPYNHLIIDEAHHFEDVATDQLSCRIREEDITGHLDQITGNAQDHEGGFAGQLKYFTRSSETDTARTSTPKQLLSSLKSGAARVRARVSEFFNMLEYLLQNYGEGRSEYDLNLRITGAMRAQPAWSDVEINCENLIGALEDLTKTLSKTSTAIEDLPVPDTLKYEVLSLLNANEEFRVQLDALIFTSDENRVHWLTLVRRSNVIELNAAPLHVGSMLQASFYAQKDTLILTGATLSIQGNFTYIEQRLGLESPGELLLGSPFDYPRAAMIYLASDLPEPGRPGYQKAVAQTLIALARATGGRCLVLFTSFAALRAAQAAIRDALAQDDILVLAQGADGSPSKLIATLKSNPRTVLLGTASFWEGVDVSGDALSVLVMVRLPFAVPTDPVYAARADTFDNPFRDYTLPQAAFKFKQGFGRLIRSKTDRGVMAVLDSRLTARNYKGVFLGSLPPCPVETGPADDLPSTASAWLQQNDPITSTEGDQHETET